MAETQRLNSKVIEKSEEMTNVVGDSKEQSNYRWSTWTSKEKQMLNMDKQEPPSQNNMTGLVPSLGKFRFQLRQKHVQ